MQRKNRAWLLVTALLVVVTVVALVLFALRQNINLFYTPEELLISNVTSSRVRLGGFVKVGSLKKMDGLKVTFTLTDNKKDILVTYSGILPDLFREGQGVVALGKLTRERDFIAEQILAKHDENYQPPELVNVT